MWGRIRQTIQVLTAWLRPINDDLAASYLDEPLYALYCQMTRSDRQHHLRVLRHVQRQGFNHPALMRAALLHDVGKTRVHVTIFDRVLAVIVAAIAPYYYRRWSQAPPPYGWRRAFVVSAHHPEWGAEMATTAGADEMTIDLIRYHQSPIDASMSPTFEQLLEALQRADNVS